MAVDILEIPLLPKFGAYRFGVTIETRPYLFEMRWNTRAPAWYMNVREVDLKPIVLGVRVVLGAYLGRRSNHRLFSRGVLVAVDTEQRGREATFDSFGSTFVMRWIPIPELILRLGSS